MTLAKKEGIDLTGYKHVIETSGIQHSENRHGKQSKDKVHISSSKSKLHEMNLLVYEKQIGLNYYYVEEIRTGKKRLAFQTMYKRAIKNPSNEGL